MQWNKTVLSVSDIYYLLRIIDNSNRIRISDIQRVWGTIPIPSTKILENTLSVLGEIEYVAISENYAIQKSKAPVFKDIKDFKHELKIKLWSIVKAVDINRILHKDSVLFLPDCEIQIQLKSINSDYKTLMNLILQCSDAKYEDNFVSLFIEPHILEDALSFNNKKTYTSAMQRRELEVKAKIGKVAENYVYEKELSYLNKSNSNLLPLLLTEDDVGAGYDILSYSLDSSEPKTKYIEVKAITKRNRFFISQNEVKTARKYGASYWIYLVYVNTNYEVISSEEINNPYEYFFEKTSAWNMEYESYKFTKNL